MAAVLHRQGSQYAAQPDHPRTSEAAAANAEVVHVEAEGEGADTVIEESGTTVAPKCKHTSEELLAELGLSLTAKKPRQQQESQQ